MAAQAGHAFLDSYLVASPEAWAAYSGTKVVLNVPTLTELLRAHEQARAAGLPHALIWDEHHVLPPHFDGKPIVTALGIGPVLRRDVHHITKRFRLA